MQGRLDQLELARQEPSIGFGNQSAWQREGIMAWNEDLIEAYAGIRRDQDVAHGVASAAARGKADQQQCALSQASHSQRMIRLAI